MKTFTVSHNIPWSWCSTCVQRTPSSCHSSALRDIPPGIISWAFSKRFYLHQYILAWIVDPTKLMLYLANGIWIPLLPCLMCANATGRTLYVPKTKLQHIHLSSLLHQRLGVWFFLVLPPVHLMKTFSSYILLGIFQGFFLSRLMNTFSSSLQREYDEVFLRMI